MEEGMLHPFPAHIRIAFLGNVDCLDVIKGIPAAEVVAIPKQHAPSLFLTINMIIFSS